MRLHYHPNSTFARRVRIAALEKDLPLELVEVDMRAGAMAQSRAPRAHPTAPSVAAAWD